MDNRAALSGISGSEISGARGASRHADIRPARQAAPLRAGLFAWVPVCLAAGIAAWFALPALPGVGGWLVLGLLAVFLLATWCKVLPWAERGRIAWPRLAKWLQIPQPLPLEGQLPYDLVLEMDEVNDDFAGTDQAIPIVNFHQLE